MISVPVWPHVLSRDVCSRLLSGPMFFFHGGGGLCLGGLCLGGLCLEGLCPGVSLSVGSLSRGGVSVYGGFCPKGVCLPPGQNDRRF